MDGERRISGTAKVDGKAATRGDSVGATRQGTAPSGRAKGFTGSVGGYIRIARPDHWIKQLFILPGVVLALLVGGVTVGDPLVATGNVLLALVATSLIASSNYVINEWLDREFDRFHPVKKNRPAVSQGLDARIVYAEWAVLGIAGMLVAWAINVPCATTLGALWVMGVVYNVRPMRTKEIPYLDVLSESLNNALRLMTGWFALAEASLPPVSIVVGYWMVGAYLMAIKRFSEYRAIGDPEQAGLYRRSFKHYTERSLLDSSLFYAMFSVFLIGVFLLKWHIEYILGMPFLCALYVLYFNLAFQEDSSVQAPEKLYHETGLMAFVAVVIVVFAVLTFARIPALDGLTELVLLGV